MIKLPRVAVWACTIVLAVGFVAIGISKLTGQSATRWAERFAIWGYPWGAQYVVGTLEIVAGLGVLIPARRRVAAAILIATMVGALCTHAVHGEFPRLIPPMVLGTVAFLVYQSTTRGRPD